MKKYLLLIWGVITLAGSPLWAAQAKQTGVERFYGRLVAVDAKLMSFTVANSRLKTQEQFTWGPRTKFVFKKQDVGPDELIAERILAVSYTIENGQKSVQKVVIRPPFGGKKKDASDTSE